MHSHAVRTQLAVALFGVLAVAGCAPANDTPMTAACDAAIAAVTPIQQLDGLFVMVSEEVAVTLEECSTPAEWMSSLRAHPEVLSMSELSAADAEEYLAQSCSFLDGEPAICGGD